MSHVAGGFARFRPASEVTRGILAYYDPGKARNRGRLEQLIYECRAEKIQHREVLSQGNPYALASDRAYSATCLNALNRAEHYLRMLYAHDVAGYMPAEPEFRVPYGIPDMNRLSLGKRKRDDDAIRQRNKRKIGVPVRRTGPMNPVAQLRGGGGVGSEGTVRSGERRRTNRYSQEDDDEDDDASSYRTTYGPVRKSSYGSAYKPY